MKQIQLPATAFIKLDTRRVPNFDPGIEIADTRQDEDIRHQGIVHSMHSDEKHVYREHIDYLDAREDILSLAYYTTHYISFHNTNTNDALQMKRIHRRLWRVESLQPGLHFYGWLKYVNCDTGKMLDMVHAFFDEGDWLADKEWTNECILIDDTDPGHSIDSGLWCNMEGFNEDIRFG